VSTARYSIVIRGDVDAATRERLGEPEARASGDLTELVCDVVDQSQLVGLLSGLSREGVEIISATRLNS
jgi:hypothetical protein